MGDQILKGLLEWGALAGFAALVALVINVLKLFSLVKDGQAQTWSAAINLLGMIGFIAYKIINPSFDPAGIDSQIGQIVQIAQILLGYVMQLGVSKITHSAVRNVPVIGKSNTQIEK